MRINSKLIDKATGSMGGITAHTIKNQIMIRKKTTPKYQRTPRQEIVRKAKANSLKIWKSATNAQRKDWERFAKNIIKHNLIGNVLSISGYNAFTSHCLVLAQGNMSIDNVILKAPTEKEYLKRDKLIISVDANNNHLMTIENLTEKDCDLIIMRGDTTEQKTNKYRGGFDYQTTLTMQANTTTNHSSLFSELVYKITDNSIPENIALGSKGLVTLVSNINNYWNGFGDAGINNGVKDIKDGFYFDYHPLGADGKHLDFEFADKGYQLDKILIYNRPTQSHRIRGTNVIVSYKGQLLFTESINTSSELITIGENQKVIFDKVRFVYASYAINLREIEIIAKIPEPSNKAWKKFTTIDSENNHSEPMIKGY